MKSFMNRWWMEMVIVACIVVLSTCAVRALWAAGEEPPADRQKWVSKEHHLTLRIPAPEFPKDRPVWAVIERRPFTDAGTEFWAEVLRFPIAEDQELPWEVIVDVYVPEPGAYEYRAYCIDKLGTESEDRPVSAHVACVPAPPPAPEIIEISKLWADVDGDGFINAVDVQLVINVALGWA